jgi:hypothetical protein
MDTATVPAGPADELDILEAVMRSLADTDPVELAEEERARRLRVLERVDAIEAAVRGRLLEAFDAGAATCPVLHRVLIKPLPPRSKRQRRRQQQE